MATKTLKKDSELGADGTKLQYDAKARKKVIGECIAEWRAITGARSELNERAGEVRERLKSINVGMKAFNAVLILAKQDEAARNEFATNFQEVADVAIGTQFRLFDDPPSAEAKASSGATSLEGERGLTGEAGYQAGREGKAATDNPHPKDSAKHKIWHENWLKAQQDIAEEMGGGKSKATGGGDAAGKALTKKAAKAQK